MYIFSTGRVNMKLLSRQWNDCIQREIREVRRKTFSKIDLRISQPQLLHPIAFEFHSKHSSVQIDFVTDQNVLCKLELK